MALEDKLRWDAKHAQDTMPHEPLKVVCDFARLAPANEALDIACGNGRHTKYLLTQGFRVTALDISTVAIERFKNLPNIDAKAVDFDTYRIDDKRYDLIVKTYFLHRPLFGQIITALNPNGVLILETFMHHPDNERKPSNPAFRLHQGELQEAFEKALETVVYEEFWQNDYQGYRTLKVRYVARKRP